MLRLIVDGVDLVLPKGAFLPLRGKNPAFSYGSVPGVWTLPLSIPYAENAITLGLPALPQGMNSQKEYSCTAIMGSWNITGTLSINGATAKQIDVSFSAGYVDISEDLSRTLLKDVELGTFDIYAGNISVYLDIDFSGTGDGSNLEISVNAFDYSTTTTPGESISDIIDSMVAVINASTSVTDVAASHPSTTILRLLQDTSTPENIVFDPLTGITVSGGGLVSSIDYVSWIKVWHDDFIGQLYTNRNSEYPAVNCAFPVVRHLDFYGTETNNVNDEYLGYVNFYNTLYSQYVANYDPDTDAFMGNVYTFVPFVHAAYVLHKICELAEITLAGDFINSVEFNQVVVDNARSLAYQYTDPDTDIEHLVFKNTVTVADHMPNMTVEEFIGGLRSRFNLKLSYDPILRILRMDSREDLFENRQIVDWSNKPYLGLPVFRNDHPSGIKWSSPKNDDDEEQGIYADHLYPDEIQQEDYQIGRGELGISSNFTHPSVQHVSGGSTLSTWKIPVKRYQGSGDEFNLGIREHIGSLLIYRGMDQDTFSDSYPYATYDDLSSTDNSEGNDISLQWKRAQELLYPIWTQFVQNAPSCTITMVLSLADLLSLDYDKWYQVIGAEWLIDEWKVERVVGTDYYTTIVFRRDRSTGL